MRIGIIAPEFPPDIGGVETYAYQFATELGRKGHDVLVFTPPHKEGEVELLFNVRVMPVLRLQYALDRLLPTQYKMDVWHVMNAAYAWLALEVQPVIVSVHGNDFVNPYFQLAGPNLQRVPGIWRLQHRVKESVTWFYRMITSNLIRRGLSRSRQVITNSHYTRNTLIKLYPQCQKNSSVGFVGVDEEYLQMQHEEAAGNRGKRLVTVCRLAESRKNVEKVLHALRELKSLPFNYSVIGDGPLRPSLQALCNKLELENHVKFTGFIPKENLRRTLASSDLFILTSSVLPQSFEGFGIAYLEANACGTPVLAARAGGAIEAVDDGITGYFVEETSVTAIVAALKRYFNGEIGFKSEHCKAFAHRFTWERVVDHAVQYYY